MARLTRLRQGEHTIELRYTDQGALGEIVDSRRRLIRVRTGLVQADAEYFADAFGADQLAPGEYVFVEVIDNGSGMSPETQKRIFDPLAMKDTAFHVPSEKIGRLPSSYVFNRKTNTLDVYDDAANSAWRPEPPFESGGGGLVSGVATAVKALCPSARVVGVEPELAADASESFHAGRLVGWPVEQTARTIADGLRVPRLGDLPWAHVQAYLDDVVTVTEDEIRAAVRQVAGGSRLVAEPSGAVAPAAWLHRRAALPPARRTVAVVSGGNLEPSVLAAMLTAPP